MRFVRRSILFVGTLLWLGFVALRPAHDVPTRIRAHADLLVGFAAGCVLLGTLVALLERRFPGQRPDPVVAAAWSIARGLASAFVVWLVVGVVTGGFGDLPEVRIVLLLLGLAAGVGHAWWTTSRGRPLDASSSPIDEAGG